MRNNTSFFGVLLLVHGVFGYTDAVKSVSVMEGDSVTLNSDVTEVQRDDIIWKFGNVIIAKINEADAVTYDGGDGKFRDRLKMDKQTGSLTITNIRTEHVGLYSVDVKGTDAKLKTFDVTVHDVVESVSVTEGDSVTLHTGVTQKQRDDQIVWKFKDEVLRTDGLNGPVDVNWSNIHLNGETGDITIRNIRRDQTGEHKLEINTSSMILHRKYYITVGEMNTVSVMEGEPSILSTGVIEIQGHDLILWKFEDHLIAEINKVANRFLTHDSSDGGRFKGRLQLHRQSGDLTVRGSRTTDSGDYHLNMSSSSYTLQRSIGVSVKSSDRSGAVSGISGASVGLMVWAVAVFLLQEV